ncbi:MAG: hypothetical protein A2X42_11355 [Candidatus Margulisbacteria bacterium GWF2_38_17]|nr:MAG: hypothetical protein A2X42_11355 [Candidatus Margulisbacteria bacterium GWF2_38_17]
MKMANRKLIVSLIMMLLVGGYAVSATENMVSAEKLLSSYNDKMSNSRVWGGSFISTLGAVTILIPNGETYNLTPYYVGGAILTYGLCEIFVNRTLPEREFEKLKNCKYSDSREQSSYNSLIYLANNAKNNRIAGAIFDGIFAAYYLIARPIKNNNSSYYYSYDSRTNDSNYNYYFGAYFGASALVQAFCPSEPETLLETYNEHKNRMTFKSGLDGTGKICLALEQKF